MEDDEKGYRWETEYEKTWESIREDASGSLQTSIDEISGQRKRRLRRHLPEHVRLGMMRHLFVIVDLSEAMMDQDLKPTRLSCSLKLLESFVTEFFDQNPISQFGLIQTSNKRAEKITELGGNPRRHIESLQKLRKRPCEGEPSLQNALSIALSTLKHMPNHSSREVLLVLGSLTSCDPGDIHDTIKNIKEQKIRCSVISLAAEVKVYKSLAQATHGEFSVILDEHHMKSVLQSHVIPPTTVEENESSLIKMGFPHSTEATSEEKMVVKKCMCHLDEDGSVESGNYACPQCHSFYCELPVECKVCGLTLVSAPHLARSYHHLFPLEPFTEMELEFDTSCAGCLIPLNENKFGYQCGRCDSFYCIDCDVFLHDSVHSCPDCIT